MNIETKLVKIDFSRPLEAQLSEAAEIIRSGGLVAFPTETVYGLGASGLDPHAAEKIYAAKGRPSDNPLIIHISKPEDAEKYCVTCDTYYRIAGAFMPGPITVILPKKDIVPKAVTGGLSTVAVRCPSNPVANKLIELAGVPVAAPSANISGKPSPTEAQSVREEMTGRIDMIIDGGECDIGLESTIVRPTESGVKLLRPGGITPEMLREVCGEVTFDPVITEKPAEDKAPEAPGMKYRHYAPRAKVYMILREGADFPARAAKYLAGRICEDENTGIICTDEIAGRLKGRFIVSLGAENDKNAHAHRLFSALRYFDGTSVTRIYAIADAKEGIGLALYNRLIKAAGYDTLHI